MISKELLVKYFEFQRPRDEERIWDTTNLTKQDRTALKVFLATLIEHQNANQDTEGYDVWNDERGADFYAAAFLQSKVYADLIKPKKA